MPIFRSNPMKRASGAVVHNGTIYLSGQLHTDRSLGPGGQTTAILANVDSQLEELGSSKANILFVEILLADMAYYEDMNAAYDAWIDRDNPPARATLAVGLASPDNLVELLVIAAASAD